MPTLLVVPPAVQCAYTATNTMNYLQRENVRFVEPEMWPPNSPDLNPVDYAVWVPSRRLFIVVDNLRQSSSSRMQLSRSGANWPSASLIVPSMSGAADCSVPPKNEEDILNIACKLSCTVLCNWHYLVVCQHNSRANFILRQHRKRKILFLQSRVGTRNRCCGQYMHCFVGNISRCRLSLLKIIKFGWDFTKL